MKLPAAKPYLIALVAVLVGWAVQSVVGPEFGAVFAFAPFLVSSMAAAWIGGLGPTLLAMAVGYLIATWFYVSPGSILVSGKDNLAGLAVYVLLGLSSGLLAELVHRARRIAEASEERFRQMAEHIRKVFWMSDPAKNEVLYVSRSYEDIWGRSCESLYQQPRSFFEAVHPDDQPRVQAESIDRQLRGEATEVEYRVVRPDGSVRWVSDRSFPVRNAAGQLCRIVGIAEDITKRKRSEDAVRESEERLRLALDAGSLGVWDWDIAGAKLNWTDRVYEIHGLDPKTFSGRMEDFTRLLHPDDAGRVSRAIDDALAGTTSYHIEFRIVRPSGETRWVFTSGRVLRDETGRAVRMLGATIDTTERKKAEETLKFLSEVSAATAALVDVRRTMQTLARLAVPFFADTCVVDVVNPSGRIERLAYTHVDAAKESLLKELAERFAIDWNSASPAVRVLRSGKPEYVENVTGSLIDSLAISEQHRRLLQELNPRSYIVAPLLSRGQAIGAISFAFSTSGRRYNVVDVAVAQELARRAATAVENARLYHGLQEAHRQKDDFLAMLAHELRNPLAAIDYAMQLSRLSPQQGPEAGEIIERQVRQLTHLIDDLLDVSRITRDRIQLQKECLDARVTVRRAVATAQPSLQKARHRLVVELSDEPLPIFADPTRVEQIVVNLLTNAAKYTPDEGEVSVRAYADNGQLAIKVKDSGIGIPPEMLSRVFELFTQVNPGLDRSKGGLGIGLTVVRRLTEMHGGSVSATSEGSGKGSEFTVRLPLVRDQIAVSSQHEA